MSFKIKKKKIIYSSSEGEKNNILKNQLLIQAPVCYYYFDFHKWRNKLIDSDV